MPFKNWQNYSFTDVELFKLCACFIKYCKAASCCERGVGPVVEVVIYFEIMYLSRVFLFETNCSGYLAVNLSKSVVCRERSTLLLLDK